MKKPLPDLLLDALLDSPYKNRVPYGIEDWALTEKRFGEIMHYTYNVRLKMDVDVVDIRVTLPDPKR